VTFIFDLFSQKNGSRDPEVVINVFANFEVYKNCRFLGPIVRQMLLPWQPFCAPLIWVFLVLASEYELDTTTQ